MMVLGAQLCNMCTEPNLPVPTLFAGKKAAMKFDVDKIFEETRRTAREYSEQASGECVSSNLLKR